MKDLLILYAKYNNDIIKKIIKLLSDLDEESLTRNQNTYYGSLIGLLQHIILGSWHYINAIHILTDGKYCKTLPNLSDIKNTFQRSISESLGYLDLLAGIFLEAAELITDEYLHIKKQGLTIYNGRIVDISVWEYFLQHITHQVHHQGQLSQLLDELNIEHEFGNKFPLIPDSVVTI